MGIVAMIGVWLVVITPLLVLLNGWVLTKLWAWFIVTGFGVEPIGIATALGISLIVSMMVPKPKTQPNEADTLLAIGSIAGASVGGSLGALGFGWVITWFM